MLKADPGSFRDRSNRVYDDGSRIVRGVNEEALRNWNLVSKLPFYEKLLADGRIIGTESADGAIADSAWFGAMSHERIPFITYPYEWSFGMLKDAALLHLDIIEESIPNGWILKDSSAYNIQFKNCRPVFIDIPSFEPYAKGEPWKGYRQFCMMFLYPLMLQAYRGIDFRPLMRSSLAGIDPSMVNRILTGFSRYKKGVFSHVYLHATMQERYARAELSEAKDLTETSGKQVKKATQRHHSEAMVLGTIQGIARTIRKMADPAAASTWGTYDTDHSYAEASFKAKAAFVKKAVDDRKRAIAWDIGCNTGTFSQICAENTDLVVSIDGDPNAIERLYQREKAKGNSKIQPLIMNLGNISPNQGWGGRERKALDNRGKPDLVLCLALIHHMVISENVPMGEYLDWLHSLGGDLVIEFVGIEDDMSQMLVRNKLNQYSDFTQVEFERIAAAKFQTLDSELLKGGARKIYYMRPL